MLVYLVEQSWGSYDDYATYIDSVYVNKESAKKRCIELQMQQTGPLTLEQVEFCRNVVDQLNGELEYIEDDEYYEDKYASIFEERTNIKYKDYVNTEELLFKEYHNPKIITKELIED